MSCFLEYKLSCSSQNQQSWKASYRSHRFVTWCFTLSPCRRTKLLECMYMYFELYRNTHYPQRWGKWSHIQLLRQTITESIEWYRQLLISKAIKQTPNCEFCVCNFGMTDNRIYHFVGLDGYWKWLDTCGSLTMCDWDKRRATTSANSWSWHHVTLVTWL